MELSAANRNILTSWSLCPAWVTSPAGTWATASTAVHRRSTGRWTRLCPASAVTRTPILLHQPPPPPGNQELVQCHPLLWSSLQWCWWASWWSGGWCLWGNKWQFSSDLFVAVFYETTIRKIPRILMIDEAEKNSLFWETVMKKVIKSWKGCDPSKIKFIVLLQKKPTINISHQMKLMFKIKDSWRSKVQKVAANCFLFCFQWLNAFK